MNYMDVLGLLTVPKISIIVRKTYGTAEQILIRNLISAKKKTRRCNYARGSYRRVFEDGSITVQTQ